VSVIMNLKEQVIAGELNADQQQEGLDRIERMSRSRRRSGVLLAAELAE
jgi:hypothetical protein